MCSGVAQLLYGSGAEGNASQISPHSPLNLSVVYMICQGHSFMTLTELSRRNDGSNLPPSNFCKPALTLVPQVPLRVYALGI